MKVVFIGKGKVGRALGGASRRAGHEVSVRAARQGCPRRRVSADLLVLAVRDPDIEDWARRLAASGCLAEGRTAVVHTSGVFGIEPLAALTATASGLGQMHPMISFADPRRPPTLAGGHALVTGDRVATTAAATLARSLGLIPRRWDQVDPALYHATGALVANGACALAAAGADLLVAAGAPAADIGQVLGPLLRSVAENIERLGLPEALTGPVRRGGAPVVRSHLAAIEAVHPEWLELYRTVARAQLPLARQLQDASPEALMAVEAELSDSPKRRRSGRRALRGPTDSG